MSTTTRRVGEIYPISKEASVETLLRLGGYAPCQQAPARRAKRARSQNGSTSTRWAATMLSFAALGMPCCRLKARMAWASAAKMRRRNLAMNATNCPVCKVLRPSRSLLFADIRSDLTTRPFAHQRRPCPCAERCPRTTSATNTTNEHGNHGDEHASEGEEAGATDDERTYSEHERMELPRARVCFCEELQWSSM